MLIPMIARVSLEYGGKVIAPREYFDALPIHAAVLNYQGKASLLEPGHVLQTREMVPEPVIASAPDPEPAFAPEPEPTPVKRKRAYKRRDLKAER